MKLVKLLANLGYGSRKEVQRLIRSEHLEDKVRMLPAVFNAEPVYFWTSRKADPELAPLIEQALARLKATGELARIDERWSRLP